MTSGLADVLGALKLSDAVHAQCREQADHPAGHADRHLGKRVVLGDRLAREAVKAPSGE